MLFLNGLLQFVTMSVDGLLADGFMCMGLFMFPGICKG